MIYKLLTIALIENIDDDDVRDLMLRSFTEIFKTHKTIPVGILVEPLLRKIQIGESNFAMNVFDFNFFKDLSGHPKLTASSLGIQLMD